MQQLHGRFRRAGSSPAKSRASMKRREFISLMAVRQRGGHWRRLRSTRRCLRSDFYYPAPGNEAAIEAFRKGLSERGFVEDVDVKVEYRWAEDRYDRLPQ